MPFATTVHPREQILDAAAELFAERGFTATSMKAIGERLGVSAPAIYGHFDGKHRILGTLVLNGVEGLLDQAGDPLDDPREDLEHLVRIHVEALLRDRSLATLYVTERNALTAELGGPIRDRLDEYRARWLRAMQRCWPSEDSNRLASVANAATGLSYSAVLWPDEALTTEDLPELLTQMTLNALATLPRSPFPRSKIKI